jgi:short-subunit dehydrogenase
MQAQKTSNLKDKVVVITGGTAGVGRAVAELFAQHGAKIAVLARDPERIEQTCEALRFKGASRVAGISLDMADEKSVFAAADEIERNLGLVDIWVNNATASVVSPILETPAEEFRRVMDVTYMGYVHGTLAALKTMKKRNQGKIIQVSSGLAYRAIPLQSAYCAGKHAIKAFTESLRVELRHDKIEVSVSLVHLPAVNTPQFTWTKNRTKYKFRPMPPVYEPEVAANAILWAVMHDRAELFVGGFTSFGLWINRFLPRLSDWYLSKTAYCGQLLSKPKPMNSPENLWQPVPGNFGVHGEFKKGAHKRSLQLWSSTHPVKTVILIAAGIFAYRIIQHTSFLTRPSAMSLST